MFIDEKKNESLRSQCHKDNARYASQFQPPKSQTTTSHFRSTYGGSKLWNSHPLQPGKPFFSDIKNLFIIKLIAHL